jgi:hypothetical protein
MKESVSRKRTTVERRRLLQLLGLAGMTPGLVAASRLASAAQNEEPEREPETQKQEENAPPEEPEITEEARELGEMAKRRYGEYLDDEQHAGLVEGINRGVRRAESMRKVVLTNADEPDFVFRTEP